MLIDLLNRPKIFRQAVAVGMLLCLVGLLFAGLISAFGSLAGQQAPVTEKRHVLGQLEAVIAASDRLRKSPLPATDAIEF